MAKRVQIVVDVDTATGKKELRDFADGSADDFKKLGKSINMTEKEFDDLNKRILQNKWKSKLKELSDAAGLSAKETRKLAQQMGYTSAESKKMAASIHGAGKKTNELSGLFGKLMAVFAGYQALNLAKSFVGTAAGFEKLGVQLKTITGSAGTARQSLEWVKEFTATTPYELNEVSQAFVQLSAYGLDAQKLLPTIGDAAASMGKGLIQGVEAIADAATGEFERLKEFGVRAKTEGDKVTFSWMQNGQQMTKTTEKNNTAIVASLEQIFKRFEGGMDEQSKTWDGMTSNLADSWTGFKDQVMQAGVFDSIKEGLAETLAKIQEWKDDGTLQTWAENTSAAMQALGATISTLLVPFRAIFQMAAGGTDSIANLGIEIDNARAKMIENHLFIKRMEAMPEAQRQNLYGKGIEDRITEARGAFAGYKAELERLKKLQADILQPPDAIAKKAEDDQLKAELAAIEKAKQARLDAARVQADSIAQLNKLESEKTAVHAAYAKTVMEEEKAFAAYIENNLNEQTEAHKQSLAEKAAVHAAYAQTVMEEEKAFAAYSLKQDNDRTEKYKQTLAIWLRNTASMIGASTKLSDFWQNMTKQMAASFSSAIGDMVQDHLEGTAKMSAEQASFIAGLAEGLAGLAAQVAQQSGNRTATVAGGAVSGAVAGGSSGGWWGALGGAVLGGLSSYFGSEPGDSPDTPNPLVVAMQALRDEVAKNTDALRDKNPATAARDELESLKAAAKTAWDAGPLQTTGMEFDAAAGIHSTLAAGEMAVPTTLPAGPLTQTQMVEFMRTLDPLAAEMSGMTADVGDGGEILSTTSDGIEAFKNKLSELSTELYDTVRKANENDLQSALRAINDRWTEQMEIARDLDKELGGVNHQNKISAQIEREKKQVLAEAEAKRQAVFAAAAQMGQPLSASQQALQSVTDRFETMRETLRGLGDAVNRTTLAAEELAAKQNLISSFFNDIVSQVAASRRDTMTTSQWGVRQSGLMDSLVNLDSSSATYYDDSVSLMSQIWEANQKSIEIQAQTAASSAATANATQKLVSYDEARMGIDKLLESLAGGDLAAAQSREFFDLQYQSKLGAITGAGSPEEAVAAVQEFSSFLPGFLSFMNAFGLDYAGLTSQATKDLQAARAGLPADYYQYESSGGGASVNTSALQEIVDQGLSLRINIADAVSDKAWTMLSFLDMTFGPTGEITETSKLFTIKMAADLGAGGDTQTAIEILQTLNDNAFTRSLVVPFAVEFTQSAGMTGSEIAELMRGISLPESMIKDVLVSLGLDVESVDGLYQAISNIVLPEIPVSVILSQESINTATTALSSMGLSGIGAAVGTVGTMITGALSAITGNLTDQIIAIPMAAWDSLSQLQGMQGGTYDGYTLRSFALNNPNLISKWMAENPSWDPTKFAMGGLIDRPTLALMGEGAMSEAVVPLPDGRSIPVSWVGGSGNASSSDNKKIEALLTRLVSAVESGRDVNIKVESDRNGIVRLVADEMQSGNPALARGVRNLR